MAIQNWSQDVLLVELPSAPELEEELLEVAEFVRNRGACDVVIDFSGVTFLSSNCLSTLLRLRKQLQERGRRPVLCGMGRVVQGILSVTGLNSVFEIGDDRSDALATVSRPDSNSVT